MNFIFDIRKGFKDSISRKYMKKEVMLAFVFIFISLLCLQFTFALNVSSGDVENINGSLNEAGKIINSGLSQKVIIPSFLEDFSKIIFALDSQAPLDLQTFIIYLVVWVWLLMIIKYILEIVPFFGECWKSWLGAIIITALASTTGAIKNSTIWFFSLGKLLTDVSILWLIFDFLVLAVLSFGVFKFLKIMKSKVGEENARVVGMRTGMP
jgi:hypothetical protein